MTRYEQMLHSLEGADPESALVFWRSKEWAEPDRAKAKRLLASAVKVAREVLP